MPSTAQRFPTRQYRYSGGTAEADAIDAPAQVLKAGAVYRFVMGRDAVPKELSRDEVRDNLHDPFGQLILGRGRSPQTTTTLLAMLSETSEETEGLRAQRVFLVADGGQIPWRPETSEVNRAFRFLLTRGPIDAQPLLFVSTTSPFDSTAAFLQVVGWDPKNETYQFYDRRQGAWVWAGSSWDALAADSRGHGPFDSHVNGALNMKELKSPWIHWHSQAAGIRDEVLAADDPLRSDPLWQAREGAELLEMDVIRPGIQRWNDARFRARQTQGRLEGMRELFGQVLGTSTVNLIASPLESRVITAGTALQLPLTFFIDSDALVEDLGLDPGLQGALTVDGATYLHCLTKYDVAITDGVHRFSGDTHFAFVVPERAFEDLLVLRTLRRLGVVSDKLAASLLMVDFANPIFSRRRGELLRYVPDSTTLIPASDFAERFVAAVEMAAPGLAPDSPEHEFLQNHRLPDSGWRAQFEQRLAAFFAAIAPRLGSPTGFEPFFELAESRRREFRGRPLAEFRLTTPLTNISEQALLLELRPDGSVQPKV